MQTNTRFPLFYRIWLIASGSVFAVSMGLNEFFIRSDYGFLYNYALLWVCFVSFLSLLVSLTAWLCRRVWKRKVLKILIVITCVLCSLLGLFTLFAFLLPEAHTGTTITGAGSIIAGSDHNERYRVYTSPEGTNQVVVICAAGIIHPYPMLNRWIYKEVRNGHFWLEDDWYTVDWPSERQAVVTALSEPEDPYRRIIVDF